MSHNIEIETCHPKQHRGHRQSWTARCHCGCGWTAEPSWSQATIEAEAAELVKAGGGFIHRRAGVSPPRGPDPAPRPATKW